MNDRPDPSVQRRRLTVELRKARANAGFTQKEVAEALEWSPSKLLRIENGQVGVAKTDLLALLHHYDVKDGGTIDELSRMAQEGRRQPWSPYRDVLEPEFLTYLGYEGSASLIRTFEGAFVPGLLQTEEYAKAVSRVLDRGRRSEAVIDRGIEARMRRKELLDRTNPPDMFFILDEAVVSRWVGNESDDGPVIMRHQLEQLKELNARDEMTIQILRMAAGAHFGLAGPFVMLEFPAPEDNDLLFLENARGNYVTRDSPEEITLYKEVFFEMELKATRKDELNDVIDEILNGMRVDAATRRLRKSPTRVSTNKA
jgi:transcriptional regulator with XRE-family HTH domain